MLYLNRQALSSKVQKMDYNKPLFDLPEKEKKVLSLKSNYIYGDAFRDRVAYDVITLPRYAKLARKVLSHYAGDKYNPHTIDLGLEFLVREHIRNFVEKKVFYKIKGYDWEFVDNFFKKVVGDLLDIDIPYDMERLEQGMNPDFNISYLHPTLSVN